MDHLVSIGVVEAKEIKLWDPEHERSFDYQIRESKFEESRRVIHKLELGLVARAISFTVKVAGNLDSESIRQLVYTEPNYISAKKIGYKSVINPDYKFAADFREDAKRISSEEYCLNLDEEQIGLLYLNYMKSNSFNVR